MTALDFLVNRSDLRDCKFATAEPSELAAGQVRVRIDKFAFRSPPTHGHMLSLWSVEQSRT